jgi:hypothetical protein
MSKYPKTLEKSSVNILQTELLPLIQSLGELDVAPSEALPGTAPIFKNEETTTFARGTTWDFGGMVFDGEELVKMTGGFLISYICILIHIHISW